MIFLVNGSEVVSNLNAMFSCDWKCNAVGLLCVLCVIGEGACIRVSCVEICSEKILK